MLVPRRIHLTLLSLALLTIVATVSSIAQEYILLGWNDLGMHCSNKDFSRIAVLPPFNNVNVQLIHTSPGGSPTIVTAGYRVEYSIPNNTYSVGKTNFWSYAQQLFGLSSPLPDNIGLTGHGLTGQMDVSGNAFTITGVPVTPFPDSDLVNENPFQLIHLVARDEATGTVLATTDAVIPVSNEVGCVQSGCHVSERSIVNGHDSVANFDRSKPILCASCHASNALGTTGNPEAGIFSFRIHDEHKEVAGADNDIATCYKCHPGPKTQCLRDIMGKNPQTPLICQNCHGTLAVLAQSIENGRKPWLEEPRCGNLTCHGTNFSEEPGKLYRQSRGHGGLFCSACHGSPHAIQPTVQPNDNLQNIRLQGYAGALKKCTVCHVTPPAGAGPHGIMYVDALPSKPDLSSPATATTGVTISPVLQWSTTPNAKNYLVQVSLDSTFASIVWQDSTLTTPSGQASALPPLTEFYWRVCARNEVGISPWSDIWWFKTAGGLTFATTVNGHWNLLSLPLIVDNHNRQVIYPTSTSSAFIYDPAGGYVQTDSLIHGRGFWMEFASGGNVSITGSAPGFDSITVEPGWNLIGALDIPIAVTSIQSDPAGMSTSPFFGYSGVYSIVDSLRPGHGYWVKVDEPGTLILAPLCVACAQPRIRINPTMEQPPPAPDRLRADGGEGKSIPSAISLEQNYPNPFNPVTMIRYTIFGPSMVSLRVYDIVGREVGILVEEWKEPGSYMVSWNGERLPNGVYTYKLVAGKSVDVKKMVLMK